MEPTPLADKATPLPASVERVLMAGSKRRIALLSESATARSDAEALVRATGVLNAMAVARPLPRENPGELPTPAAVEMEQKASPDGVGVGVSVRVRDTVAPEEGVLVGVAAEVTVGVGEALLREHCSRRSR